MRRLPLLISVLAAFATVGTNASADTVRFVCTNAEGGPELVEVNFDHKTVLEYDEQNDGSVTTLGSYGNGVEANISSKWIRWNDPFDGTNYSMGRATGVLKKLIDGGAIYTKHCKALPAGSTGWK